VRIVQESNGIRVMQQRWVIDDLIAFARSVLGFAN